MQIFWIHDSNGKCPTQFRLYSQHGVCACDQPVTLLVVNALV